MTKFKGKFDITVTGSKSRKPMTEAEIKSTWKHIKSEEKRSGKSSNLTFTVFKSMMNEMNKAIQKHNKGK